MRTLSHLIGIGLLTVLARAGAALGGYTFIDLYNLGPSGSPNVLAAGQAGGTAYGYIETGSANHAAIWSPTGQPADIHPPGLAGINNSTVSFGKAGHQVGYGYTTINGSEIDHALAWNGSAASAVDLNPTALGMTVSVAWGTDGANQQVGHASVSGVVTGHAFLWTGTAASAVDLHPSQIVGARGYSTAFGTDGVHQVGDAGTDFVEPSHAILWTGTAQSAVDLQPKTGFTSSLAGAVSGTQEVGEGVVTSAGEQHALLWTGSADSVVDLNNSALESSQASATNGVQQVGFGNYPGKRGTALVWSGTAGSMIDLGKLTPTAVTADPSQYFIVSIAGAIDAQGNIYGSAYDGNFDVHVVEWAVTPEPAALMTLMIGCGLIIRRRRDVCTAE